MKRLGNGMRGLLVLAALVVVAVGALLAGHTGQHTAAPVSRPATVTAGAISPAQASAVPDRAFRTLSEIDAGRWPDSANAPGTRGGERWQNRGGALPRTDDSGRSITYQEWDVNPKQPGQSRDAERIITGSDGSAYYTGDHYRTFARMR